MHALAQGMDLGLAHCTLDPQQETVIRLAQVIKGLRIGDQRISHVAEFQQSTPFRQVPGQSGHLAADDNADKAETNLGDKGHEPRTGSRTPGRTAEVIVNDLGAGLRPTELLRTPGQAVLQRR